jgi:hypothetical protein
MNTMGDGQGDIWFFPLPRMTGNGGCSLMMLQMVGESKKRQPPWLLEFCC